MSARNPKLVVGGEPRVQLLPPYVYERAKTRAAMRLSAFFLVIALVVVGGGVAFGMFRAATAEGDLALAQQAGLDLVLEQSKYMEGQRKSMQVEQTRSAIVFGDTTDIDWPAAISAVRAALPEGTAIKRVIAQTTSPWGAELATEGPLRKPRKAVISAALVTPHIVEAAVIHRALEGLDGYVDSYIYESTREPDGWNTKVVITYDETAFTQRWSTDKVDSFVEAFDQPGAASTTGAPSQEGEE